MKPRQLILTHSNNQDSKSIKIRTEIAIIPILIKIITSLKDSIFTSITLQKNEPKFL